MFTLPETNSKFAPENEWLEYSFSFGARPIFRGELLVSGSMKVRGFQAKTTQFATTIAYWEGGQSTIRWRGLEEILEGTDDFI